MTLERYAILQEQAELRAKLKTLKQLAHETGFCPAYCQQIIERMRNGVEVTVICSTLPSGPLEPEKNQ